jgi:hypothetical protein
VNLAFYLALAATVLLLVGALVLRSVGSGLRIGRLLSGTRLIPIEEALQIATSGEDRYVRVSGRMSSDEEFPDEQNRPLVFRRTRIDIGRPGATGGRPDSPDGWMTILDEREAVTFGVETRSAFIAVDDVALGEGLVVIPRVSTGLVSDLPADVGADIPAGTDPGTPARLTIDQLSAVEHATVVGRPTLLDGRAVMTVGNGKPLIVTTLDQASAMRVLARGRRSRVVLGAVLLSGGLGLLAGALIAFLTGA